MKIKFLFSIIVTVAILPMLSSAYGQVDRGVIFWDYVGPTIGIIILVVICTVPVVIWNHKRQKKNRISKTEKNDSQITSNESKKDKNFLDTIQGRLAKGEISLEEYTELKKELQ